MTSVVMLKPWGTKNESILGSCLVRLRSSCDGVLFSKKIQTGRYTLKHLSSCILSQDNPRKNMARFSCSTSSSTSVDSDLSVDAVRFLIPIRQDHQLTSFQNVPTTMKKSLHKARMPLLSSKRKKPASLRERRAIIGEARRIIKISTTMKKPQNTCIYVGNVTCLPSLLQITF